MIKTKVVEPHKKPDVLTFPVIMMHKEQPEMIVLFESNHHGVPLSVHKNSSFSVGVHSKSFTNAQSNEWEMFTGTLALCNEQEV